MMTFVVDNNSFANWIAGYGFVCAAFSRFHERLDCFINERTYFLSFFLNNPNPITPGHNRGAGKYPATGRSTPFIFVVRCGHRRRSRRRRRHDEDDYTYNSCLSRRPGRRRDDHRVFGQSAAADDRSPTASHHQQVPALPACLPRTDDHPCSQRSRRPTVTHDHRRTHARARKSTVLSLALKAKRRRQAVSHARGRRPLCVCGPFIATCLGTVQLFCGRLRGTMDTGRS